MAVFDYIDNILIVLSATSDGVYIFSCVSVVGAPIEIAGAIFTLTFSLATGIMKKLQISMIKFLCWLKVKWIALKL